MIIVAVAGAIKADLVVVDFALGPLCPIGVHHRGPAALVAYIRESAHIGL